jgi:RHS repeat-associated protein
MTSQSQAIVWKVDVDPFGNELGTPIKTVENNLRFPGQYLDAESGLHYNYFRDYDPKTGRYIEPDPIGVRGGLNIYGYTQNNPIISVDPRGLARWTGYLTVTAGGEVYGGGVLIGYFESEVQDGKKANVVVVGAMGGVTAGWPLSTTTGKITLETPGSPNPNDFFGAISFVSANTTLPIAPGFVGGAAYVEIGQAKSTDLFSLQFGIDASTSGYVGWSFVVWGEIKPISEGPRQPCK